MDTDEQIVREMAERGPFKTDLGWADCDASFSDYDYETDALMLPANHEPTCLWRRARERYPKPVVPAAEFVLTDATSRHSGEMGRPPA